MKILAQNEDSREYTVLAPLPGTTVNPNCAGTDCKASLSSYIPGLFNLMIGVAAVIAVAYIIWGGIEYITTDSWNGKQDGKNRIWNAVIGLVIVITSYLILYTINPKLLELNLNIEPTTVTAPAGALTSPGSPATASCIDCVQIPGYIAIKNGGYISSSILPNVIGLNDSLKGTEWQITEANPPSSGHTSACHNDGTCFDANFLDTSIATDRTNINNFLSSATSNGFGHTIYEVATQAAKDNIINSGKISEANKAKIYVNTDPNFTAPHFHVAK
jgi:hypothetical protein